MARIDLVRILGIDRGRATREDDADRVSTTNLISCDRPRHDHRIHVGPAHPSGDQLCILRTEVYHQHRLVFVHPLYPLRRVVRAGVPCPRFGARSNHDLGLLEFLHLAYPVVAIENPKAANRFRRPSFS